MQLILTAFGVLLPLNPNLKVANQGMLALGQLLPSHL